MRCVQVGKVGAFVRTDDQALEGELTSASKVSVLGSAVIPRARNVRRNAWETLSL